jgi:NADPH:quinone reductase-like Zn-dependent oxidoreductase
VTLEVEELRERSVNTMPYAICIRRTDGPEVLSREKISVGDPDPGQVRLRQAAAGVNYIDIYHRIGFYPQPLPPPLTQPLKHAALLDQPS